LLVGLLGY
jgi:hypothetical protein